jgi:hypothetical protein
MSPSKDKKMPNEDWKESLEIRALGHETKKPTKKEFALLGILVGLFLILDN